MKEPSIYTGSDGSKTLLREDLNETYHSRHGAIPESLHVFVDAGLNYYSQNFSKTQLNILELGFGTGLNAMLSYQWVKNKTDYQINYTSYETIPLSFELVKALNYDAYWGENLTSVFQKIHECQWDRTESLDAQFKLLKIQAPFEGAALTAGIDLVFFDAFAPDIQPELWNLAIFKKIYAAMSHEGVLVTYSSKGEVRRNMLEAGFKVEKLDGPPRKRHMLRAIKHGNPG